MSDRFFVITGGPGAGKTTLVEALKRAGFAGSVEAGRAVIRRQMALGGRALPWSDPLAFAERMLAHERHSYRKARRDRITFFDRGLPDLAGYLILNGLPVPPRLTRLCRTWRYARRVFIAPPWPEIYATDTERRQGFAEAVRTHDVMTAIYPSFGYRPIELPRASVADRIRFVLRHLE